MCRTASAPLPRTCDVILGRGKMAEIHPGNKAFQEMVALYVPRYHATTSRKEKNRITHELVQLGYSKGIRFLRRDTLEQWVDADVETVRVRVGQSLRYIHKHQQLQQFQEQHQCSNSIPNDQQQVNNFNISTELNFLLQQEQQQEFEPMEAETMMQQVESVMINMDSSPVVSNSNHGSLQHQQQQPQEEAFREEEKEEKSRQRRRRSSFLRGSFLRRGSASRQRRESCKSACSFDANMQLDSGFMNVASGDLKMEYETDPLQFSEDFSFMGGSSEFDFGKESNAARVRMDPFRRSV